MTRKTLSALGHTVRKDCCISSHTGHLEGDVESGAIVTLQEFEGPERTSPEILAEKAKDEFRRSLHKVFSDPDRVEDIMSDISFWIRFM